MFLIIRINNVMRAKFLYNYLMNESANQTFSLNLPMEMTRFFSIDT